MGRKSKALPSENQEGARWRTYGKLSGITAADPSMLWVLLDEDALHINDAAFAFGMEVVE